MSTGHREWLNRSEAEIARHFSLQASSGNQTTRNVARRVTRQGRRIIKITEDVRKYAAEPSGARQINQRLTRRVSLQTSQQGIAEEEALRAGMAEKATEFNESGAELYAKA